jgi:hypothetical protein
MRGKLLWGVGIAVIGVSLLLAGSGDKAAGKPQKFNLADLANGESRTFGEGDHAMTATRRGDDIEIAYRTDDGGKAKKQTIHCTIGKDSCYAYTIDSDGKSQVVVLDKSGSGKDGDSKELTKVVLAADGADRKDIMVLADEGDDDAHFVMSTSDSGITWVTADGTEAKAGAPGATATATTVVTSDSKTGGSGVHVIKLGDDDQTLLRCPEGDATLTLKKGEENSGPYFCPKHNLKMEAVKGHVFLKKIEVTDKPKSNEY